MAVVGLKERKPLLMHEAFHEQAELHPDATCLIYAETGETLTYKETQHKVLQLAHELKTHYGATLESVVGIYMEPSVEQVIALLAILTAGAAYVPLELAYPIPMLQNVLTDSKPVCIVTTLEHKHRLPTVAGPEQTPARVLCVDDNSHQRGENFCEICRNDSC